MMILSCGEVLWDLFPEGARFGGAPANFACHAALLGGEVSLLSAVGLDERGTEAFAILQRFGIDTSLIQRINETTTGTVDVTVDPSGKPSYTIQPSSAWDHIAWSDALKKHVEKADAVYFGTLGQRAAYSRKTIRRALNLARTCGIPRVLDVNLRRPFHDEYIIRESMALASVVKLSEEELDTVAAACNIPLEKNPETTLLHLLNHFGLDHGVMTCGPEGALLVTSTEVVVQPGIPTLVCDTVGAGDSFTAAFTLGLLRGESLRGILRNACKTASAVCSKPGAVPVP